MPSDSRARRAGRPAGPHPETQELLARVHIAAQHGRSNADIAQSEHISSTYVRLLLRMPFDGGSAATDEPAPVRKPRPPQLKLSKGVLLQRAALAMLTDSGLMQFEAAQQVFWLKCVVQIHALGEADGLAIGRRGDRFQSHAGFAKAVGGAEDDLEAFFVCGLLIEREGGIDLPVKLGLKPPRPFGGWSGRIDPASQAAGGGVGASPEEPAAGELDETKILISLSSDETETPISFSPDETEILISLSPAELARIAAAAALSKTSKSLSSSSSTGSRAGADETEMGVSLSPDEREIPAIGMSPIAEPQQSALATLTDDLMDHANIRRAATPEDLGVVQTWLDDGFSADAVRAVIGACTRRRTEQGKPPPTAMRYFHGPLLETRLVGPARATASPALKVVATPALSAEEKSMDDRLSVLVRAALSAGKSRIPPIFQIWQKAVKSGHEAAAQRWLVAYEACFKADRTGDLPAFPDFIRDPAAYEDALAEIEENLTAPAGAAE